VIEPIAHALCAAFEKQALFFTATFEILAGRGQWVLALVREDETPALVILAPTLAGGLQEICESGVRYLVELGLDDLTIDTFCAAVEQTRRDGAQ
jgi:hypothetical protein